MRIGISCESVEETISMCVHGVPVKFECGRCDDKHRITLLESQVKALTDMYKEISCMVVACSDHKIRQIDENRKISRRVDELEDFNKRHIDCNQHINERMEKLSATLCSLSGLYGNIKTLENIYKTLHKCPVCDGTGKVKEKLSSFVNCKEILWDCTSCEGKGIVWG